MSNRNAIYQDAQGYAPVKPERSRLMGSVRSQNTGPELLVRRILHAKGYRFRLHGKGLPGRPDIVLPRQRKAIFVNGCFWHRHPGCSKATKPKTRREFWERKFKQNVARDQRNLTMLDDLGWDILIIWECETKDTTQLTEKLCAFLSNCTCQP